MKKTYQTPETNVIEIEIHGMLAASPPGWNGEVGAPAYDDEDDSAELDAFFSS